LWQQIHLFIDVCVTKQKMIKKEIYRRMYAELLAGKTNLDFRGFVQKAIN